MKRIAAFKFTRPMCGGIALKRETLQRPVQLLTAGFSGFGAYLRDVDVAHFEYLAHHRAQDGAAWRLVCCQHGHESLPHALTLVSMETKLRLVSEET